MTEWVRRAAAFNTKVWDLKSRFGHVRMGPSGLGVPKVGLDAAKWMKSLSTRIKRSKVEMWELSRGLIIKNEIIRGN